MKIRRTFALATATAALGGGLALAPATSASAGEMGAQAMTCSTSKVSNYQASGWCSGGSNWRVGIKCTDGQHYYSGISSIRGTKYVGCGKGTVTHRWIDIF